MIVFRAAVLALVAGIQGQDRLRVVGPQPAVVVYPETSRLELQVQVANEAEMRRVTAPVLPRVDGLQLEASAPSSSQQSIFDGRRMLQTFSVTWPITIRPQRVGEFTIPSFDVSVGNGTERTPAITLRVVKDIAGDQFGFLHVRVRPERVYVHEPVRVTFELGVDQSVQVIEKQARSGERYLQLEVIAPWLEALEGSVPIDAVALDPNRQVYIVHADGRSQRLLPVEFGDRSTRNGRAYHTFRFERRYLPSRAGKLVIPTTSLGFEVFTGETRVVQDFFGAHRERVAKTYFVYAPEHEVEVLPLPETGRPTSFSGAVGQFVLEARVDRTRVRVGNSVKLIVTIRGEGNLEFFEPPDLGSEIPDFHLLGSKVRREKDFVEATYDLTPLRPDVVATPPVTWNYFDTAPGVERYVEATAPPIALTVEALPEGEGLATLPGEDANVVVPGVDDIFDMIPLAEGEPARAVQDRSRGTLALAILSPWVAALGWVAWRRARRRALADVAGLRGRGARKTFARALEAGTPPFDAFVGYLADRLAVPQAAIIGPDLETRLRERGLDAERAGDVVRVVEAGVAARYGGAGGVDRARAESLVSQLEGVDLRRPRSMAGAAGALLLACSILAPAPGQDATPQDPAARGEAAYRAGDYAAAAAAFAAAARGPQVDRRVYYNLGNALYRQGQLGRALAAYERARLGMPRDPQLAANIALVRSKLQLGSGEGEPFLAALASLRDSMTVGERRWACIGLHALAATLLVLGWRRQVCRVLGFVVLVPATVLSVEILFLAPGRPPAAIVVAERAGVVAEPRAGLDAVVKLRRGARVHVLGEGPQWVKVRAGAREGYVPADAVEVID